MTKQPREQKVPVTIKSSITLLLRMEHHMCVGAGLGEDPKLDTKALEMCKVRGGQ